jgi:hypothetical protein
MGDIKVLLFVRPTKTNSVGQVPIYFRATIDGKRFETAYHSICRAIQMVPRSWKSKRQHKRSEDLNDF